MNKEAINLYKRNLQDIYTIDELLDQLIDSELKISNCHNLILQIIGELSSSPDTRYKEVIIQMCKRFDDTLRKVD